MCIVVTALCNQPKACSSMTTSHVTCCKGGMSLCKNVNVAGEALQVFATSSVSHDYAP